MPAIASLQRQQPARQQVAGEFARLSQTAVASAAQAWGADALILAAPPTRVQEQPRLESAVQRVVELADVSVRRLKVEDMKWDWGEGLLLYSLARLDETLGTHRYTDFIHAYYEHHLRKGLPAIDRSDRVAPALAALELYHRTGDPFYWQAAAPVYEYIRTARPTRAGGLNHLGTSWLSHFYPTSMWVDSLMMYDVFAAHAGAYLGDPAMSAFAAGQPLAFASVLQDPGSGLWRHAWLTKQQTTIPKADTFWARGNGWALAGTAEVLESLPADSPLRARLAASLNKTAAGLLPYQSETGLWSTVLNKPRETYLESSGTALFVYGLLKGVRLGYLPAADRAPADKAFLALLDRLQQHADGPSMPDISGATNPYNQHGYSLVPRHNDLPYGLAALILAGSEYARQRPAG